MRNFKHTQLTIYRLHQKNVSTKIVENSMKNKIALTYFCPIIKVLEGIAKRIFFYPLPPLIAEISKLYLLGVIE